MATAPQPVTTIPPIGNRNLLPSCADSCDALYAGNAQCVPPAIQTNTPAAYTECFCRIVPMVTYRTTNAGVCTMCDAAGESSIAQWFSSICSITANEGGNNNNNGGGGPAEVPATTTTGADGKPTSGSSSNDNSSSSKSNEPWINNHWQWVIMIVVLVVGIAAIWIGACVWRRRYLRRKDRQSTLGQKQSGSASHPSWGPGLHGSESAAGFYGRKDALPTFAGSDEKPRKEKKSKKWTVTRRT